MNLSEGVVMSVFLEAGKTVVLESQSALIETDIETDLKPSLSEKGLITEAPGRRPSLKAEIWKPNLRVRPLSFRDAACALLFARPGAQPRRVSLAIEDVREAQRACVCCQTQAGVATSSPFVENFV
jgi:hypothetical protein